MAHSTSLASHRQQRWYPHRAEPRFLAEKMGTYLASPTPTQGRASGLGLGEQAINVGSNARAATGWLGDTG